MVLRAWGAERARDDRRGGRSTALARRGLLVLLFLWILIPAPGAIVAVDEARPADAPGRGRLEGSIALGRRLSSRSMRFHLYQDAVSVGADRRPGASDEMRNVVVYLESAPPGASPPSSPPGPPVIRQEGLVFVPHVLPIVRGSTVEFPNGDPIFHNVFSLSRAASFDLGRYPRGASRSVRFETPGIVKVFCHIHSDMSAVILVLDNPFFAIPGSDGAYRLGGIPAGRYRATAWHERARPVTHPVVIRPGASTAVDFTIPLDEAADGG